VPKPAIPIFTQCPLCMPIASLIDWATGLPQFHQLNPGRACCQGLPVLIE
jgi:hypothetical protein